MQKAAVYAMRLPGLIKTDEDKKEQQISSPDSRNGPKTTQGECRPVARHRHARKKPVTFHAGSPVETMTFFAEAVEEPQCKD